MEEKYNHGLIHLNAGTYIAPMIFKTDTFVLDEEYYSKVSIYIELSGSEEEGYIIIPEAHRPTMLLKGDYSKGGTATIITDFETLFNDRDLLGRVTIYYDRRVVEEFSNYEMFWEAIKRESI